MGLLDDFVKDLEKGFDQHKDGREDGTKGNKDIIKYATDEHYREEYDDGEGLKDGSKSMKGNILDQAGSVLSEPFQKAGRSEKYKRGFGRGKATYGTAGDIPPKLFGEKKSSGRGSSYSSNYGGRSSNSFSDRIGSILGWCILGCILAGVVLLIICFLFLGVSALIEKKQGIRETQQVIPQEVETKATEEKIPEVIPETSTPNTQPIIDSVTDSLGRVYTNSWAKDRSGAWTKELGEAAPTISIGDIITFSVNVKNASDLLYKFEYSNAGGYWATTQDWSNSNIYTWTVPDDAGYTFYGFRPRQTTIIVSVKNKDELNYYGDFCDDCTYLIYTISEPSAP